MLSVVPVRRRGKLQDWLTGKPRSHPVPRRGPYVMCLVNEQVTTAGGQRNLVKVAERLHVPALNNPIIHSFTNHVAARSELAGAYVVLEQSEPSSYFWSSRDPLMALLVVVDDLCRGAQKKVVVNYLGTIGIVASALGAEVWSSGYFLNQRRFSLKAKMGIAHPRYHSLAIAGDIGLKSDLAMIRDAGFADECMTPTTADAVLRSALKQGKSPANVPEWRYSPNNCTAAQ
jgi:hypothetical protein